MASSGTMTGSNAVIGGVSGSHFYINWQLASQSVTNNTSKINWQAKFKFHHADAQLDNGIANLSGTRWSNGGRVHNFAAEGYSIDRYLTLASGSFTISHNSDGTKTLDVSGGIDVYQSGRSSGSQSWSLPTIPRNSQVSTNDSGHYTLGTPLNIYTNRKSSSFTHTITIRMDNSSGTVLHTQNNVGSSWTWTPSASEITTMQNHIPNANSLKLYIDQYNNQVKAHSSVYVTTYLTDANPTFTDFTFKDSNTTVVGITGDNQVLVKGQSTLQVTVPSTSKMVANKGSSADHYAITYDGTTNQTAYATTDVTSSFTPIVSVGDRTILVGAYDSRGNSTTVSKLITVYDYVTPTISTTLTRANNFESDTTVHIEGTYTPLVIGGSNKNSLTTGTLQYRYQEDGGTFGSWVTKTFTADTTAGTFSVTDFVLSLDNTKKYNFEFHINDKFGQVTTTNSVDVGTPIMFVGQNNGSASVGINKMPTQGALDVEGDIYSNGEKVKAGGGFAIGVIDPTVLGTQVISGLGFTPKLIQFFTSAPDSQGGAGTGGYGMSDGVNNWAYSWSSRDGVGSGRLRDKTKSFLLAGNPLGGGVEISFAGVVTSIDSDGFTVNITTAWDVDGEVWYNAFG